jgi:Bacteriophage replication gene A protein (GPA)
MKVNIVDLRIEGLHLESRAKKSLYSLKDQLSIIMFESVLDEIEEFKDSKYIKINEFLKILGDAKKHVVFPFIKNTDYKIIRIKAEQVLYEIQVLRENFPELTVPEMVDYFNDNKAKQLELPIIKINTKSKNLVKNLTDIKYWRRKLRTKAKQEIEKANFLLGLIGKNGKLSSKEIHLKYRDEEKFAEKISGVNQNIKLQRRFNQYRCFLNGMLKYAGKKKMSCAFITILVPAEYHVKIMRRQPDNFITPKEINNIIEKKWNAINKKISEGKIELLGCKVVEPHKDGTPHWHMMLWSKKIDQPRIKKLFKQKFSDFLNIRESNLVWVERNNEAYEEQKHHASYLLKTLEPTKKNEQIRLFRSVWRIRALAFFGIPDLDNIWRACRGSKPKISFDDPWMNELQRLARGNHFCEFLDMIKEHPFLKERFK